MSHRSVQSLGGNIGRKENITALIQHMTMIIEHGARLCAVQAGAHVSLCR